MSTTIEAGRNSENIGRNERWHKFWAYALFFSGLASTPIAINMFQSWANYKDFSENPVYLTVAAIALATTSVGFLIADNGTEIASPTSQEIKDIKRFARMRAEIQENLPLPTVIPLTTEGSNPYRDLEREVAPWVLSHRKSK